MSSRVLVFDDDAAIGRLVVRVPRMAGMEATAVTDAAAFAEHLTSYPPQIVLLDLQLGDTDGVEQLRLLAERQYSGLLVLMSGFDARVLSTARALGQSLGLKVEAVLEKPLRVAELEQVLRPAADGGSIALDGAAAVRHRQRRAGPGFPAGRLPQAEDVEEAGGAGAMGSSHRRAAVCPPASCRWRKATPR